MDLIKHETVSASMMDTQGCLSVYGTFLRIQDAVTELMGTYGIDGFSAKVKYDALWVYVKTHVKFFKKLFWRDAFTVTAFLTHISTAKIAVDVSVTDDGGENVAYSRTELCALDIPTQRIRRTFTVGVDKAMLSSRPAQEVVFSKFGDADLSTVATVQAKATNIDFSHHVNNTEYVRMILDAYSVAELESMDIREMEVLYANQSFEGNTLRIKRAAADGRHLVAIEKDGATVVKCEILCEQ